MLPGVSVGRLEKLESFAPQMPAEMALKHPSCAVFRVLMQPLSSSRQEWFLISMGVDAAVQSSADSCRRHKSVADGAAPGLCCSSAALNRCHCTSQHHEHPPGVSPHPCAGGQGRAPGCSPKR